MKYEELKQNLEQNGYLVKFSHYRLPKDFTRRADCTKIKKWADKKEFIPELNARGGFTEARILKDNKVLAEGEACCSVRDVFSKHTGRTKALFRAYSELLKR